MTVPAFAPRVWLIDPISYSGLAYTDVGQVRALQEIGARPVLASSDSWMLDPDIVPRLIIFRGTSGSASRLRRGAAYVVSLARLLRRVRNSRPDIVHWQFTELPVADLLAMVAIRAFGIPQAYTAHELLPWTASRHHRQLFKVLYGVVDAIVVHNVDQKTEIIRGFKVDPAKVHIAPLGGYALFTAPDLPQTEARARLDVPPDIPVALFFGTIRPSKGLEVLLEAWALVAPQMPDALLLVTGKPYKGLDTSATTAQIHDLGIEDSVRTRFEQVDPVDANAYYRASDVVVLPYHEIGTSGVLRYAYDSGRAVIATSVGEHGGLVVEGETGYQVPPADPGALARILTAALADRSRLASMGESARTYATANIGWLKPAADMLRMYADLIEARSRRGPKS